MAKATIFLHVAIHVQRAVPSSKHGLMKLEMWPPALKQHPDLCWGATRAINLWGNWPSNSSVATANNKKD